MWDQCRWNHPELLDKIGVADRVIPTVVYSARPLPQPADQKEEYLERPG